MEKWTRVMYQPNLPLKEGQHVTASKEHITLSKEAAKEGMVLLKMIKTFCRCMPGAEWLFLAKEVLIM